MKNIMIGIALVVVVILVTSTQSFAQTQQQPPPQAPSCEQQLADATNQIRVVDAGRNQAESSLAQAMTIINGLQSQIKAMGQEMAKKEEAKKKESEEKK
jgi:hypothetical protein